MSSEPGRARVFLHVGVPKSGTSFLQATLRANADRLLDEGVWYPTQQHRGLFHAALELTGNHPGWGVPQRRVDGSWAALCAEARRRGGTAVFSNELFSNVEAADVPAALAHLDGLEVHLVVTARDLARQLPAEGTRGRQARPRTSLRPLPRPGARPRPVAQPRPEVLATPGPSRTCSTGGATTSPPTGCTW